jgi:opacity protein-like surface antigen
MSNKILLTIILFITILFAKDEFSSERFLGIEAGYGEVQTRNVIGVPSSTKGVEFGFRFGAQNEEWRTTISGHNFNKNNQKYFRGMLSFDRFVWASLYKTDNIVFKPYIGGHIGWLKYVDSKSAVDNSGYVYGGQVGLAWNVLKEVDFDFGYRYSISNLDKVDDIGSFVFAVNYLY